MGWLRGGGPPQPPKKKLSGAHILGHKLSLSWKSPKVSLEEGLCPWDVAGREVCIGVLGPAMKDGLGVGTGPRLWVTSPPGMGLAPPGLPQLVG